MNSIHKKICLMGLLTFASISTHALTIINNSNSGEANFVVYGGSQDYCGKDFSSKDTSNCIKLFDFILRVENNKPKPAFIFNADNLKERIPNAKAVRVDIPGATFPAYENIPAGEGMMNGIALDNCTIMIFPSKELELSEACYAVRCPSPGTYSCKS